VVRAVVFDFDGLIVDTETPIYTAWSEVYRDHGQELTVAGWATCIGHGPGFFDPILDLEGRLGRALDRDTLQAGRRRRELELVAETTTQPGVREWHREALARGMKLGVASSSSLEWVAGHLERIGLDGWACIRCGDQVARRKPAPDVYLAVVECLGVAPDEALAVEDSGPGTQAARAAGMRCVAVPSAMTASHDFSAADLCVPSLADVSLGEVLRRVGS
jgi:beta-phosphoglucomutase-like phosphatase (HAD superfamily)